MVKNSELNNRLNSSSFFSFDSGYLHKTLKRFFRHIHILLTLMTILSNSTSLLSLFNNSTRRSFCSVHESWTKFCCHTLHVHNIRNNCIEFFFRFFTLLLFTEVLGRPGNTISSTLVNPYSNHTGVSRCSKYYCRLVNSYRKLKRKFSDSFSK